MRPLECPHCYSRVGVLGDGICPHCRKNVDDLSGVDPHQASLIINVGARLPELCCRCASHSTLHKKVSATQSEEAPQEPESLVGCLLLPFGTIPRLILKVFQGKGAWHVQKLTVSIPVCGGCAGKKILPVSTLLDSGAIKIVVHRTFKEEYLRLNGLV